MITDRGAERAVRAFIGRHGGAIAAGRDGRPVICIGPVWTGEPAHAVEAIVDHIVGELIREHGGTPTPATVAFVRKLIFRRNVMALGQRGQREAWR